MKPTLTDENLTLLAQGVYAPLVELYRRHTPLTPRINMLAVVHNLLFILAHPQYVRDAIAFYNNFYTLGMPFDEIGSFDASDFFPREEDWNGGILRDDWQIPFQIGIAFTPEMRIDPEEVIASLTGLAPQVIACYQQAKASHRTKAFCRSFEFNSHGCIPERLMPVFSIDWSTPADTTVHISFGTHWFSKTWAQVKDSAIATQMLEDNVLLDFRDKTTATLFIQWLGNHEALRPMGVMTYEANYCTEFRGYRVAVDQDEFNRINTLFPVPASPAPASTAPTTNLLFRWGRRLHDLDASSASPSEKPALKRR